MLPLDEPFSALDPTIRGDLQQQFLELTRRRGIASILVTHDPAEAVRRISMTSLTGKADAIRISGSAAHCHPRQSLVTPLL